MVRNTSKFKCEICRETMKHDQAKGHSPPGWSIRKLNGIPAQLCEKCGSDAAWIGGPSPRLKEDYLKHHDEELRED